VPLRLLCGFPRKLLLPLMMLGLVGAWLMLVAVAALIWGWDTAALLRLAGALEDAGRDVALGASAAALMLLMSRRRKNPRDLARWP
jgi:hypothetical protein